jgi:hypothetical protein
LDSEYQHIVTEETTDNDRICIAGNLNFHEATLEPAEVINA